MSISKDWLTSHELAEHAGIAYPNLWTYRKRGILPMPDLYIGNKPMWSRQLVDSWDFERQTIEKVTDKTDAETSVYPNN